MTVIYSQTLQAKPSVAAVIAAAAESGTAAVLDSSDPQRGRHTIIGFSPVATFCWLDTDGDPFEVMRGLLAKTAGGVESGPFAGAWIGYFSYECGRWIEPPRTPPDPRRRDIPLPVAMFALYDTAAVYDAWEDRWEVVAVDIPGHSEVQIRPATERISQRVKWLSRLKDVQPKVRPAPPAGPRRENMTREEYLARVRRAKEYIAAGDIFQVNLTRRMSFPLRESPVETYLRLRTVNPAAYSAFLQGFEPFTRDRRAILSASPESFLELRGREVITRPIKGTRPRSRDSRLDAGYRAELASSPKDRAELAMIVDLERNDLGRVCEYGSVKVVAASQSVPETAPFELEEHPTVHHLVGTVRGRLREERDAIDLLRATFPGGSITGAPKVRAMEIIEELEPTERSVYTGAIGCFGLDGSMSFNIAIRTLIVAGDTVHLQVGGGIVADSVPEDEYEETQAKARGLLRALGVECGQAVAAE